MPPSDIGFALVIGAVFGILAAACAFVITFSQYHNQFMDSRKHWDLAFHAAMTAFIAFFVLAGLGTWAFRLAMSR